jgi:PAS domain S-box-containing protein
MPWIVFVIGTGLTLLVFMDTRDWDQRRMQLWVDLDVEVWRDALAQDIRTNLRVVEDLKAFLQTVGDADRATFGKYAALLLKNYSAIRALEWIPRVPDSRRAEFEAAARRDGFPAFQFTERSLDQSLIPAGRREECFPVYYVEPYANNEKALGYDLASEENRKTMLNEVRDHDKTGATRPITLVQQEAGRRGILIASPIYQGGLVSDAVAVRRENLKGYALGVLDVNNIVDSLIIQQAKRPFHFLIYDKDAPPGNHILYAHLPKTMQATTAPVQGVSLVAHGGLMCAKEIKVAGRTWVLVCTPTASYMEDVSSYMAWFILGGGLVFSVLISIYVSGLSNRAEKVGRLVHLRTLELDKSNQLLRASEEKFARAFSNNPSPMVISSFPELRILDANKAFLQAVGCDRGEVIGFSPAELRLFADARQEAEVARRVREEGQLRDCEITLRRKSGAIGYGILSADTIVLQDQRVLLTVLQDITARKLTEERKKVHQRVLEMLAANAPLKTILEVIALSIEKESPGCMASILLLDRDGKRLRHGAAPSLPEFYNEAIDGLVIGDGVGSCGTAAVTKQTVIVEDVQTHPYWAAFCDLARRAGVGSCWSVPVVSMGGQVLGTFAIYHRTAHVPSDADLERIRYATGIASTVIGHELAEELIQASEQKYRILFESSHDALMTLAPPDWRFMSGNPMTVAMFRAQDEAEFVSKGLWEVSPEFQPDGRRSDEKAREMIETAMRSGTHSFEWTHTRLDGEAFPALVLLNRVELAGLTMLQATVRDITEQKRVEEALRESEGKFRLTTTTARDAIVILDSDGRVTFWNQSAEKMLGYSNREVIGRELHPLLAPERYQEAYRKGLAGFRTTGLGAAIGKTLELAAIRKDGVEVPVELSLSVAQFNGQWHALAIMRDITGRKRVMEELRQAKETADFASRAKSQFLARMSHEIRTPLNAVLGFTQLLLREPDLAAAHRNRLEAISSNGEHLLALITEVLDMSKIETGRLTLQPSTFDLSKLFRDVETMFHARAQARQLVFGMEMIGEFPRYACGDENKIRQVLVNLIGNAIKFTNRGGIEVRVRKTTETATTRRFQVEIEDTGRGISSEELPMLFQPFSQLKKGQLTDASSGLGLYISRQFARLMEGDISVTSQVGVGSKFCFTFVVECGTAQTASKKDGARPVKMLRPDQPPCRVLIVDDVKDNRMLLDQMLSPARFTCYQANSGLEVLSGLKEWNPDLILMDVQMPGMDGKETIRRIRAGAEGKDVKIISITASAFEDDRQEVLAAGADVFLPKPIQRESLFAQIKVLLGVEYLYEDEPATVVTGANGSQTRVLTRESMALLPGLLLKQLHEAIVVADFDRVMELIQQVETMAPLVAQSLRQLAGQFESEKLLELTETETETT